MFRELFGSFRRKSTQVPGANSTQPSARLPSTDQKLLPPLKIIKTNHPLAAASSNKMPLENMLKLAEFSALAHSEGALDNNLRLLDPELIRAVEERFGGHGLTNLMILAMGHERWEFEHFISFLRVSLMLQGATRESEPVKLRNSELPGNGRLQFFNTTYMQTTLARRLYAAGRHPGALVYGVSGPRILVSHPFQGIAGEIYNMYANASDLVAALSCRGYHGRFHFFDYLSGLDDEIRGVPRWAIWFSIVAQHSDLVIFVKRFDGDFGPAQRLEAQVIPDWVPKTIEEVSISEIQNAETPRVEPGMKHSYWTKDGELSRGEWLKKQREESGWAIESWIRGNIPKNRFVHMEEQGTIKEYPLNYPLFR